MEQNVNICEIEGPENLKNTLDFLRKNYINSSVLIVNNDNNFSSAVIHLNKDTCANKIGFTKSELTFHLPPPRKVKKGEFEDKVCVICQDNFRENELYRFSKCCNNIFHKKCIDKWYYKKISYNCPMCRNNN